MPVRETSRARQFLDAPRPTHDWYVHSRVRALPQDERWECAPRDQVGKLLESMWQWPAEVTAQDLCLTNVKVLARWLQEKAEQWERETRYVSSMTDVVENSSYQQIIKVGQAARRQMLRLLLDDMISTGRPWFTALMRIAGENPVNPADAGRFDRMEKAWVKWGKKEGLL